MSAHPQGIRTPDDRVVVWRRRMLERAGFPPGLSWNLARDARYDLHALIELTERGCPPALAGRILAPLEPVRAGRGVAPRAGGRH